MKRTFLSLAVVGLLTSSLFAETYVIDENHSAVTFTIRHLVGRVAGSFAKFSGKFDYTPGNPKAWKTDATIDIASINTSNAKRDEHLRTPDFFDAQKYPAMTFKSTEVKDATDTAAKLHGYLTLKGVTKPVVLDVTFNGMAKDPMGTGQRVGITATTKVNRKDFGITNAKDVGGMVGDDVDIVLNIQGVSSAPAAATPAAKESTKK